MNKLNQEISIIMPCFNKPDLLKKSIKSILNQTHRYFEFIIVDDCSDYNTKNILEKYKKKDGRIRLYFNKINRGPSYTFNRGLYLSKNNYIARMDSDDISHPNRIEKQLDYLNKNPTVFAVGTGANLIDKNDKLIRTLYLKENDKEIIENLKFTNPLINSSFMANTNKETKKLLYLKKIFYPADDYYSWYRIIKKDYKLTNINEILFNYRIHESESVKKSQEQGLKTLLVQKIFKLKLNNLNLKYDNLKSISQIKFFLNNLPHPAKPSSVELFYYEFNDKNQIFNEKLWFFRIIKLFFYVRNSNDLFLYIKLTKHCLKIIKDNFKKKIIRNNI